MLLVNLFKCLLFEHLALVLPELLTVYFMDLGHFLRLVLLALQVLLKLLVLLVLSHRVVLVFVIWRKRVT